VLDFATIFSNHPSLHETDSQNYIITKLEEVHNRNRFMHLNPYTIGTIIQYTPIIKKMRQKKKTVHGML
jgi:hypothetical protein